MERITPETQVRGVRLLFSYLADTNANANANITPRSDSVCPPVSCRAIFVSKLQTSSTETHLTRRFQYCASLETYYIYPQVYLLS
jgi:hypothetical protein